MQARAAGCDDRPVVPDRLRRNRSAPRRPSIADIRDAAVLDRHLDRALPTARPRACARPASSPGA